MHTADIRPRTATPARLTIANDLRWVELNVAGGHAVKPGALCIGFLLMLGRDLDATDVHAASSSAAGAKTLARARASLIGGQTLLPIIRICAVFVSGFPLNSGAMT